MQGPLAYPEAAVPLYDENGFSCQLGNWPLETQKVGSRIAHLVAIPGNARNDMIIAKQKVGRIIGPGGSTLKVWPEAIRVRLAHALRGYRARLFPVAGTPVRPSLRDFYA